METTFENPIARDPHTVWDTLYKSDDNISPNAFRRNETYAATTFLRSYIISWAYTYKYLYNKHTYYILCVCVRVC